MQQFSSSFKFWGFVFLAALLLSLAACGGGNNSSSGGSGSATNITLSPSPTGSLNFGEVRGVTAAVKDDAGNAVSSAVVTWSSSNTNLVSVTPTGGLCGDALNSTNTTCVCAGQWKDTTFIDCLPSTASGTATLTATSGSLNASITLFVHPRVARVAISAPQQSGGCSSVSGTIQASAQAFDAANNPVTVGTDQTAFSWNTSDNTIATVSTAGLVTAVNPGIASISATASNTTSVPVNFNTCAVRSISTHVSGATDTSFTNDTGTTKTLVADVVDTKGAAISLSAGKLTWSASHLGAANTDQAGLVTVTKPGASAIVASCRAPGCNKGYDSNIYSNTVVANVNGTTSATLIVGNSSSTSLYPIDAAGTVGTAITLPSAPNSIVFARTELGAYIGTDTNLLAYDATQNAIGTVASTPGIVLGVSNNGSLVVVFDNTANTITVVNNTGSGASQVDKFTVAGIPASCRTTGQCPKVSFSPESQSAFVVAGSKLYVSTIGGSLRTISLSQTANDVAVTTQGSFAFVANSTPTIDTWTTCNFSQLNSNSINVSGAIQRMVSSTNGLKLYAVTPPSLTTVNLASNFAGCPPTLNTTLSSVDLGQGTFNTRQLIAADKDNLVVMLTDGTQVVIYDVANNSGSAVTLSGGANVLTGGVTADGAFAYVGGSDSKVHKIDLANKTDASQITIPIVPEFVGVRSQ